MNQQNFLVRINKKYDDDDEDGEEEEGKEHNPVHCSGRGMI